MLMRFVRAVCWGDEVGVNGAVRWWVRAMSGAHRWCERGMTRVIPG